MKEPIGKRKMLKKDTKLQKLSESIQFTIEEMRGLGRCIRDVIGQMEKRSAIPETQAARMQKSREIFRNSTYYPPNGGIIR